LITNVSHLAKVLSEDAPAMTKSAAILRAQLKTLARISKKSDHQAQPLDRVIILFPDIKAESGEEVAAAAAAAAEKEVAGAVAVAANHHAATAVGGGSVMEDGDGGEAETNVEESSASAVEALVDGAGYALGIPLVTSSAAGVAVPNTQLTSTPLPSAASTANGAAENCAVNMADGTAADAVVAETLSLTDSPANVAVAVPEISVGAMAVQVSIEGGGGAVAVDYNSVEATILPGVQISAEGGGGAVAVDDNSVEAAISPAVAVDVIAANNTALRTAVDANAAIVGPTAAISEGPSSLRRVSNSGQGFARRW
jgi:hypothetical protein